MQRQPPPPQVKCPKCQGRFRPEPVAAAEAGPSLTKRRPPQKIDDPSQAAPATPAKPAWQPGGSTADLMRAVVRAFEGQTVRRRPTWGYRFALLFSAFGLCLLVVAYFLCIAGVGFGLYQYALHVVPTMKHLRGRAVIAVGLMHAGVGFAGLALLYSLVVPLFRWGRARPEGAFWMPQTAPYCIVSCRPFVR